MLFFYFIPIRILYRFNDSERSFTILTHAYSQHTFYVFINITIYLNYVL